MLIIDGGNLRLKGGASRWALLPLGDPLRWLSSSPFPFYYSKKNNQQATGLHV